MSGGLVVFSGGSAANALVDVFNQVVEAKGCSLSYVIPISDNGGSSSELIRFFGGPGIGDVRSRLVRLIPPDAENDPEGRAIKAFFNHRLNADPLAAKLEWQDLVEARHWLWDEISSPKMELIRSFLNFLNLEIWKRARPTSVFGFESASVGNLFLTGARLFVGSLESAIYLVSSICSIPPHVSVLPAINTNFSYHICAGLADGSIIPGQNAISHPSIPTALPSAHDAEQSFSNPADRYRSPSALVSQPASPRTLRAQTEAADTIEDANLPGSLPTLRQKNIAFSKAEEEALPARIERIWYINPYGQELRPPANPKVLEALAAAGSIVYSIGSLYTSVVPSLVPRGVGEAIAAPPPVGNSGASTPNGVVVKGAPTKQKILILNGTLDRESGPPWDPLRAIDFARAIAKAGMESRGLYLGGGREVLPLELRDYVTHIVHLEGEGAPMVDKEELAAVGIETVRVYGRRENGGKGWRYDEKALKQTLVALIGMKGENMVDKGRRSRSTTE